MFCFTLQPNDKGMEFLQNNSTLNVSESTFIKIQTASKFGSFCRISINAFLLQDRM